MSKTTVEMIIRRAVVDAEFRNLLVNHPAEVLVGYDLTEAERANLSQLNNAVFDSDQSTLEDRVSRGTSFN